MEESKRFMIDDAGTLIDIQTRNTYDYVNEVIDLLNNYEKENNELKRKYGTQGVQLDHLLAEQHHLGEALREKEKLKKELSKLQKEYQELYTKYEIMLQEDKK